MQLANQGARGLALVLLMVSALLSPRVGCAQTTMNVALAANGGVASASSIHSTGFPAAGANNGDTTGADWGAGGGWNDGTAASYPDWLQVTFSGPQTVGEIDVFTVQDNYQSPLEPTAGMTFSLYGLTSFQVQYWTGTGWSDVPGGNVSGNNLVWRKFTFAPINTDRIRVVVNGSLAAYSRITEVQAWTASNAAPSVVWIAPANGATFVAPATIDLAASASDTDGSIAKVEFYRWNTLIATTTATPYNHRHNNVGVGSHGYWARAIDNRGAVRDTPMAIVQVADAPPQRSLSLTRYGGGSGSVISAPGGIECGGACTAAFNHGTVITLTASPVTGSSFSHWGGACSGLDPVCQVTLIQDLAVSASFAAPATTAYQYDANGNLTQVTDPLGNVRKATYDALDRPYLVQEPHATTLGSTQGQITTGYDGQSQVTSIKDPRSLTTTYTVDGLGNVLTLASPDTGTTTYTYDEAGNLKTRLDARGKLTTYSYDALNRVTQVSYGDQTVSLTWDSCAQGIGRLCRIDDGSGSTTYSYDAQGRVTGKTQAVGTVSLATGYGYNSVGQLTGLTTPSGQTITYEWSGGRVSGIRINGTPLLTGIDYEPFGPVAAWTWGNGEAAWRNFDLAGRPYALSLGRNAAGQADARNLGYDAGGRIRSVMTAATPGIDQFHSYDGLDRLTATRLGNPAASSLAFSYDLTGNRSSQTLNGSITGYTTAAASNRLESLSGAQVKSFAYDAAGNQTASGSLDYGYDNAGRKTSLTVGGQTWAYAYSALGERVQKVGPGGTTLYAYDLQGHLLGEYDGTGNLIQETVWLGDTPVATIRPGGSVYYVHADHLNTPRRITRPSDNLPVWEWESPPFGDTSADENPAGLGAFSYNLRFPGQVYDVESGTNYNYFRDYEPGTGRYVQSDPIGLEGGINTYSYVGGNPLSYTDPLGLKPGDLFSGRDDAALDAGAWARTQPQGYDIEHGGWIYKDGDCYTYNAHAGRSRMLDTAKMRQLKPASPSAIWHTHPVVGDPSRENNFSGELGVGGSGDRDAADRAGVPIYLHTPAGDTKMYDPIRDSERTLPIYSKPKPCGCQ